jgi:hypothetical protein
MRDELDAETRRKVDELLNGINELFANKTLDVIMMTLLDVTAFAFAASAALGDVDKQIDEYAQMLKLHAKFVYDRVKPFPRKQ